MFEFAELIEYVLDNCEPSYDSWGLPVYKIAGGEYAIAVDEEAADQACAEYIKETAWAFSAWFIKDHCKADLPEEVVKLIQKKCEGANSIILDLIEDLDAFVEDAISEDGRGHFLSSYDGNEHEVGDYLIYQVN